MNGGEFIADSLEGIGTLTREEYVIEHQYDLLDMHVVAIVYEKQYKTTTLSLSFDLSCDVS